MQITILMGIAGTPERRDVRTLDVKATPEMTTRQRNGLLTKNVSTSLFHFANVTLTRRNVLLIRNVVMSRLLFESATITHRNKLVTRDVRNRLHKHEIRDVRSRLRKQTTRVVRKLLRKFGTRVVSKHQRARNEHQQERNNGRQRRHKVHPREHSGHLRLGIRNHANRSNHRSRMHREVRKARAVIAESRNVVRRTAAAEAAIAGSVSYYSSSGSPSRDASLVSSQATNATLPAAIRARMTPANGRIVRMLK